MLPSVSVVSKSACRLGSSGFAVRSSSRALGGFVASVGFVRPALAAQFARFFGLPCFLLVVAVALSGVQGGCFWFVRFPASRLLGFLASCRFWLLGFWFSPCSAPLPRPTKIILI